MSKKLGLVDVNDPKQAFFYPDMSLQHQEFFSNLPYFVFGNLDAKGTTFSLYQQKPIIRLQ